MDRKIRIVMALNYYAPYVSGLTEAARLVAEELVRRGHRVVVVASQHDRKLPRTEMIAGVKVVRTPVVARIGKGVVSPRFVSTVVRFARQADVLNLHMPMLESGAIAFLARHVPTALTYQCDIALPPGMFNRVQSVVMDASNAWAMRRADAIVPSSLDYARRSRLARLMSDERTMEIAPPTRLLPPGAPTFRETDGLHVGFLGRLVEEKGIEFLVDGFRQLDDPDARLLLGGDFRKVSGGSVADRVRAHIGDDPRIKLLGFIQDDKVPDFYASLDVFALPSVNSFEAFGIVQVEAMKRGIPVLASDLPGVRVPVERTHFGTIVRRRDSVAIAEALRQLASQRPDVTSGTAAANALYDLSKTADEYEALFHRLL